VKTLLSVALVWIALLWGAASASALEVRQTLWGFDGQVVPDTFNILSVLVSNRSPVPFDGQIVLDAGGNFRKSGPGHEVAACYLGPGEARWVQFYPFFDASISNSNLGWSLRWGRGPESTYDLDAPKLAAPAAVWLVNPEDTFLARESSRLKRFPENLFPSTASATDGLDTVALDHAPRWEPARRAAFLDWLRRGGVLHLLPDAGGRDAEFSDELAALNVPLERQHIGAGLVVRHRGARDVLLQDAAFLKEGPAAPTLEKSNEATIYDLENSFFQQLAAIVRPKVNWALIYLLTLTYLGAVSFGHYFWAKRTRDYRLSLLALLAGVTAFAILFALVGRRGFGESARVNTLSLARALDDGRYDVMQWSNAFVVRGGVVALTHPSAHNLYSAGSSDDQARSLAVSGLNGHYEVEIPLFSSSAVLHRGVMAGDNTSVKVNAWESREDRLVRLSLAAPEGFPSKERVYAVWVRWQDRFYSLVPVNGAIELNKNLSAESTETFLSPDRLRLASSYVVNESNIDTSKIIFDGCQRVLIARALGGTHRFARYLSRPPLPDDQADLFVLASLPDGFRMKGVGLGAERGLVVYQRTLFKPQGD
jgi:hypothetical protein